MDHHGSETRRRQASTTGAMDHGWYHGAQLLVQAAEPRSRVRGRIDLLLEHDLLRRMLKALAGKLAPVRHRPMTAVLVDPPMAQVEGEELLAFATQVVGCRFSGTDQITDSLLDYVRYPYPAQLARLMQPRQRDRVPSVRLDPLARPLRRL